MSPLKQLFGFGQSFWYDGLASREEFERMIREDGLRGATTNPTIFEKTLDLSASKASLGADVEETYRSLAVRAVQDIADLFAGVHKESAGADGFVSLEVSPLLAYDTEATVREGLELSRRAGRPNVMIKVPATRQGVPAVSRLIAEGVHVNVTLIFSVERYREVMDATLEGLERRARAGKPVSGIASVASFFVSRVDTAVDALLQAPELESLRGKAAVANSKFAYAAFKEVFGSARFSELKAAGARVQRPLWASTSAKNPSYRDVIYVEELIGPDTVNTMPPATVEAFRDHGQAAATLENGLDSARRAVETLARHGVDLSQVTRRLEEAGVKLFEDSYRKLLKDLEAKISNGGIGRA